MEGELTLLVLPVLHAVVHAEAGVVVLHHAQLQHLEAQHIHRAGGEVVAKLCNGRILLRVEEVS